jgi:hypothetical protein
MFLKQYTGFSDAKLIEHLCTDWSFLIFCDISPTRYFEIQDVDVVGRWRGFFGHRLDLWKTQTLA